MNNAPTTYAIRVHGHLDDHWSAWLGEPGLTRENDGTTTITAVITDQAQLHGVLAGLRDIGAVITDVRSTPEPVRTRRGTGALAKLACRVRFVRWWSWKRCHHAFGDLADPDDPRRPIT